MKSVHKALKLRHHKHTGKLLHHRHTSYRMLFLLMSVPVVVMIAVSQVVSALDYQVTATVPANVPAGAPVITAPAHKSTVTTSIVTISGTCPASSPAVIVALYDNSLLVGSQDCRNQEFAIPISLSLGTHTVRATIMTITGQTGASSSNVELTRIEEVSPVQGNGTTPAGSVPTNETRLPEPEVPLRIVSDRSFITFELDNDAVWHGRFVGGDAPYKVEVLWGDGDENKLVGVGQEEQTLRHRYVYAELAAYRIKVRLTDAKGRLSVHQTVAVTFSNQGQTGSSTSVAPEVGTGLGISIIPLPLIVAYAAIVAALTFLWYRQHTRSRRFHPVRVVNQSERLSRRK